MTQPGRAWRVVGLVAQSGPVTEHRAWMPPEDLEYDLAHEIDTSKERAAPPAPDPVYVPTATDGYDGDYGYDLAHDVPGR